MVDSGDGNTPADATAAAAAGPEKLEPDRYAMHALQAAYVRSVARGRLDLMKTLDARREAALLVPGPDRAPALETAAAVAAVTATPNRRSGHGAGGVGDGGGSRGGGGGGAFSRGTKCRLVVIGIHPPDLTCWRCLFVCCRMADSGRCCWCCACCWERTGGRGRSSSATRSSTQRHKILHVVRLSASLRRSRGAAADAPVGLDGECHGIGRARGMARDFFLRIAVMGDAPSSLTSMTLTAQAHGGGGDSAQRQRRGGASSLRWSVEHGGLLVAEEYLPGPPGSAVLACD